MTFTTRTKKSLTAGALLASVALVSSSCALQSSSGIVLDAEPGSVKHYDSLDGVPITVGAKNFTEQLVLGNMYSIILHTAGMDVTNHTNTPGSNGVRNSLVSGGVDITPDYTGTGWIDYLGNDNPVKGEKAQWEAVNKADKKNGVTWLPYAPENNTYAFATGPAATKKLKVDTLSDLKKVPMKQRTFCVESEFASRNDGFEPMLKKYGLTLGKDVPKSQVTRLDTGAVYKATAEGKCNFGEVFSTDGRILSLKLHVLKDDKQFFPRYNLTAAMKTKVLKAHPEIADIFATVNPKLTNKVMLELNGQVDVEGRDPALVALDWLKKEGFVK